MPEAIEVFLMVTLIQKVRYLVINYLEHPWRKKLPPDSSLMIPKCEPLSIQFANWEKYCISDCSLRGKQLAIEFVNLATDELMTIRFALGTGATFALASSEEMS